MLPQSSYHVTRSLLLFLYLPTVVAGRTSCMQLPFAVHCACLLLHTHDAICVLATGFLTAHTPPADSLIHSCTCVCWFNVNTRHLPRLSAGFDGHVLPQRAAHSLCPKAYCRSVHHHQVTKLGPFHECEAVLHTFCLTGTNPTKGSKSICNQGKQVAASRTRYLHIECTGPDTVHGQ